MSHSCDHHHSLPTTIIANVQPLLLLSSTLRIAHIWANLGWAHQCTWPLHCHPSVAMSPSMAPTTNCHITADSTHYNCYVTFNGTHCKLPHHWLWQHPLWSAHPHITNINTAHLLPPCYWHWYCPTHTATSLALTLPNTHHHITVPTRGRWARSQQMKGREDRRMKGGGAGIEWGGMYTICCPILIFYYSPLIGGHILPATSSMIGWCVTHTLPYPYFFLSPSLVKGGKFSVASLMTGWYVIYMLPLFFIYPPLIGKIFFL